MDGMSGKSVEDFHKNNAIEHIRRSLTQRKVFFYSLDWIECTLRILEIIKTRQDKTKVKA